MPELIKTCIDVLPSQPQMFEATRRAREESPANEPDPVALSRLAAIPEIPTPQAAVMLTGKRWRPGREIRISFMDGPESLRMKVRAVASRWLRYANLRFRWVNTGGEIRITFTRGGSYSYLGTDALVIPKERPTMQFGWLSVHSDFEEIRRVTLHEFGHALGLGHEHGHPRGEIPWNKEAAYQYYGRQGWSRAEVDAQVFQRYAITQTNFSKYDPTSIMHYAIPAGLLTDPARAVGWNTSLSLTDRKFIGRQYPFTARNAIRRARQIMKEVA